MEKNTQIGKENKNEKILLSSFCFYSQNKLKIKQTKYLKIFYKDEKFVIVKMKNNRSEKESREQEIQNEIV